MPKPFEEKEIEYDKFNDPVDETPEEDEYWLPEDDVEEDEDEDWCEWEDRHSTWGEWP